MEKIHQLQNAERRALLYGPRDRHLRMIRDAFGIVLAARNDEVHLQGAADEVHRAHLVLEELERMVADGQAMSEAEVQQVVDTVQRSGTPPAEFSIDVFSEARAVRPQTPGQLDYCRAMGRNDLVFCIGPAGTGKTYLAVATAVHAFKTHQIKRIVLVRPAVEAGERLGFLPGDLQDKVNPYLRPLLDALHDMVGFQQVRAYIEADIIEVIPLAYMRGRTLNDAFIILDEAQNTTTAQMKMFLTRMGMRSKMVVTGDVTQVDLKEGTKSGLVDAWDKLSGIDGVDFHEMTQRDIVRHRLVQAIVSAYDRSEKRQHRRHSRRAEPPRPTESQEP